MAFLRGSTINPALGRTDFTPFLQGSMAGAQGILEAGRAMGSAYAGVGQTIAGGIDAYKKNKEETKKLEGFVKAAEEMSRGFGGSTKGLSPEIAASIENTRKMISDPSLSLRERASASQAFLQFAPDVINKGFQAFEMEQREKARQAQEAMAAQQFLAQQQAQARNQMVQQGANAVAMGGNVPSYMPNAVFNEATLAGRERAAKLSKAEMEAKPAPAKVDVPSGYRPTQQGNLEPIPGGPAAEKLANEAAKAEDAKRMADERAARLRESAANTFERAKAAYDLVAIKKAGGPWEGWFPKVSAKLGLEENRDLLAEINTIKASLTLDKIMEMRAASKTGGSPLGVVSDKDVQLLGASVAELETDLTEAKLKENLQRIAALTAKIAGIEVPKLGAAPRPNTLKGSTQSNRVRTYNPQTGRIE